MTEAHYISDGVKGETCHQCRQKTLGLHTCCSKCNLVQEQFCGDCLYMRYREKVIEVNKNPDWICPVCRGICNCSLCRPQINSETSEAEVGANGPVPLAHDESLVQKDSMHDEKEEGYLVAQEEMKEVIFMGSKPVDASDEGNLDAVAGETKEKPPRRRTRVTNAESSGAEVASQEETRETNFMGISSDAVGLVKERTSKRT